SVVRVVPHAHAGTHAMVVATDKGDARCGARAAQLGAGASWSDRAGRLVHRTGTQTRVVLPPVAGGARSEPAALARHAHRLLVATGTSIRAMSLSRHTPLPVHCDIVRSERVASTCCALTALLLLLLLLLLLQPEVVVSLALDALVPSMLYAGTAGGGVYVLRIALGGTPSCTGA
ncbi:MAG: hypothetical protein ACK41Y_16515, partial [Paracoccus hibiscisoli]|uniref:hypothetical protein n=1 Tax=Paracoccus hibiscisoli TaxID=2023261 RepID=UPI00391BE26C